MRRPRFTDFSFTPLVALAPGLTLLAAFAIDGALSASEIALTALLIVAGAAWAGPDLIRTVRGEGYAIDADKSA